MTLYLIEPAADPDDPLWQDRPIWRRVVVKATTPALARVAAAALDRDTNDAPVGNESASGRSGFEDEKLYWVRELAVEDDGGASAPGPILEAVKLADGRRP